MKLKYGVSPKVVGLAAYMREYRKNWTPERLNEERRKNRERNKRMRERDKVDVDSDLKKRMDASILAYKKRR
jgi:hypothetical protein